MTAAELLFEKARALPPALQTEALHYVEFLLQKASAPGATIAPASDAEPEPSTAPPERRGRITTSPITGLPVIETGGPVITSEMVREALADFP